MPTNKEISDWLREVEQEYKQLASDIKSPFNLLIINSQLKWGNRAKLVEQMRCETCKHYRPSKSWDDDCGKFDISYQGKDFGCFEWEPKK